MEKEFARLLGAPPVGSPDDQLETLLDSMCLPHPPPLGRMLAAAWRSAVLSVSQGIPSADARNALQSLSVRAG